MREERLGEGGEVMGVRRGWGREGGELWVSEESFGVCVCVFSA